MAGRKRRPLEEVIQPSVVSMVELKATKELFKIAVDYTYRLYSVFEKSELSKALNICAWISRFPHKLRRPVQKVSGALTTTELENQHMFWVKRGQQSCEFQDVRLRLTLQPNPGF